MPPDMSPYLSVLAALALTLVALIHYGLRRLLHRKARQEEQAPVDRSATAVRARPWLTRGLRDVVPPLAVLLWVHGLYVLATFGLDAIPPALSAQAHAAVRWGYSLGVMAGLLWLLVRIGRLLDGFLVSLARRAETRWDDLVLPLAGKAVRLGLPLLALILGTPVLSLSPALAEVVRSATSLALIAVIAFILAEGVDIGATFITNRHRIDSADNLEARAIYTQVVVLKKVAMTVIGIFTIASMLMVFEPVRQFGASILASAGIAGIVLGFAAQRSLATLLAGFQIALTQPIRVDDVVVVEEEWGRIEEITLTYVVVRIWDLRRLIVPITNFIEKPVQNWTRTGSKILGTVILWMDYTVPVEPVRAEVRRILSASKHWDGDVNVVQVTDATDRALQLRVLVSAGDAGKAFDLRCEIREKLIAFIQQQFPESLPRIRALVESPFAPMGGAATETDLRPG
jgi:small-conductance mechanosensitive channel